MGSLAPTVAESLARLRGDLRLGLPCLISGANGQAVIVAVEQLSQARLDALCDLFGAPELILTGYRGLAVMSANADPGHRPGVMRIAPPAQADLHWYQRLVDAALDGQPRQSGPLQLCDAGDETLPALALTLAKTAELLPAVILFALPPEADMPADLELAHIDADKAVLHLAEAPALSAVASAALPLMAHDAGRLHVYREPDSTREHYALEIGTPDRSQPVLSRLHSACFTGDVLGSLKCDCGPQLQAALDRMGAEGAGVLLYLNQEGRGIGLANKMRTYDLQAQGFDTVEANHRLGFEDDERDFRVAAVMLRRLGFQSARLLTNNPAKVRMFLDHGITITEQLPLRVGKNAHNTNYLAVKALKSGHAL